MTQSSSAQRHQFGALPYRRAEDGTMWVYLITSRDSGRWTIPKGNPMPGKKPHRTAAIEALEESGLTGKIAKKPLGSYVFWKRMAGHFELATVTVFPLPVDKQRADWKEKEARKVEAFPAAIAATLVVESGLTQLILRLADHLRQDKPPKIRKGPPKAKAIKPGPAGAGQEP